MTKKPIGSKKTKNQEELLYKELDKQPQEVLKKNYDDYDKTAFDPSTSSQRL